MPEPSPVLYDRAYLKILPCFLSKPMPPCLLWVRFSHWMAWRFLTTFCSLFCMNKFPPQGLTHWAIPFITQHVLNVCTHGFSGKRFLSVSSEAVLCNGGFKGLSAEPAIPNHSPPLYSLCSFLFRLCECFKLFCQGLGKCHELFPAWLPGYGLLSFPWLPSHAFCFPFFLFLLSLTLVLGTLKLGYFYILPGPPCLVSHDFWVIISRPERPLLPGLCMLVYFMSPPPYLTDPST